MLQPVLLSLPDVGLYTLSVPLLRFVELGKTLRMSIFIGGKVTGQSQEVVDFWGKSARNLWLPLATTASWRQGEVRTGSQSLCLCTQAVHFWKSLNPQRCAGSSDMRFEQRRQVLRASFTGARRERLGRAFLGEDLGIMRLCGSLK
jgi:hypothetical protein